MIIIFGSRATHIGNIPAEGYCPHCGQGNLYASVYQRYAHIFWAPLFPVGRTGGLFCAQCGYAAKESHLEHELRKAYRRAEAQAKTPLWTWAALMAIGALVVIGVIVNMVSAMTHHREMESLENYTIDTIPIPKETPVMNISQQLLDTTKDGDLPYAVFDKLISQVPDYEKEYQTVTGWNKSKQAIYVINLMEGEVNNGGHNQFYYNASGQFAELVPEALKLIGAVKHAGLMNRANTLYAKEKTNITKNQDGTLEGFSKSYENNLLGKLDDEFYAMDKKESLVELEAKYIREHKQDFME